MQDFVLDHPIPTFLEKQYWFKQHFVVFSAKKVICVSTWKLVSSKSGQYLVAFEIQEMVLKSKMVYMKIEYAIL